MSSQTPSVLARILDGTREELVRRKRELPQRRLQDMLPQGATRSLRAALATPEIAVIAEFKRRSPSAGVLREGAQVGEMVDAYARGGAAALSVLTEGPGFGGSLDDLRAARKQSELPILRKDFVVDEYQLLEARAAGADAALLIVAALDAKQLEHLHDVALELGLEVLVEVHDRSELERALAVQARVIGVNNRDLRDFSVDVARTSELRAAIPAGVTVVSESGISEPTQLQALQAEGVDAVLVGELLMRAADPAGALRELLAPANAGGRDAAAADPDAESETAKLRAAQF
ncbi:MAG: indole-3-glycerol phosphate synthase TrpC [Solirubrobacteraceae bacterium]